MDSWPAAKVDWSENSALLRNQEVACVLLATLLVAIISAGSVAAEPTKRPDIILIVADNLGHGDRDVPIALGRPFELAHLSTSGAKMEIKLTNTSSMSSQIRENQTI